MSNFNIMRDIGKRCFLQLHDRKLLFYGGAVRKVRSFTNLGRCPPCVRYYHEMRKQSITSSNSSSSSSFLKFGFVGWYLRKLETHPVVTKSITSSLIFVAADLTSQTITMSSSDSYDLRRTLRMATYALFILGPSQHMWFNFMSKAFPRTDVPSTLKKILMGQAVFGPIINTVFFSYNSVLQGESGSEIVARLKRDLVPTLLGGAMFWPVCDFVTFKFIQVQLQPLMNSSCAYVWTIYLTYMANR
ncbi:hypothetical protein K1719_016320 [Acacia pycnantha]|nr:hypothetical protein K1719_016320 [Acacia pycnantha]